MKNLKDLKKVELIDLVKYWQLMFFAGVVIDIAILVLFVLSKFAFE